MKFLAFKDELTEEQKKNNQALVDALRSGDFSQYHGLLCNGQQYCCLGVASEIQKIPKSWRGGNHCYLFPDGIIDCMIPSGDWFEETYGWNYKYTYYEQDGEELCTGLYLINDDWGWTFDKIADLIEAIYLKKQDFEP